MSYVYEIANDYVENYDYLDEGISSIYNKITDFLRNKNKLSNHVKEYKNKIKKIEKLAEKKAGRDVVRSVKKLAIKSSKVGKYTTTKNKTYWEVVSDSLEDGFMKIAKMNMKTASAITLILLVVIFINTAAIVLLTYAGLSSSYALMMTAIFVAPIIEEIAKVLALRTGIGDEYMVLFTFAEFGIYVVNMYEAGFTVLLAVIIRSLAIIQHYFYYALHKQGYEEGKQALMSSAAIVLHGLWNFGAIVPVIITQVIATTVQDIKRDQSEREKLQTA